MVPDTGTRARARQPRASIGGVSSAVVAEAVRRSGVLWLLVPGGAPVLVWHLWHDGAAHVVGGGGGGGGGGDEQALPALGASVDVVVRTPSGDRLEWTAEVEVLAPGTAAWDEVVPLLAAERQSAPSVEQLPALWARHCTVVRLTPAQA